MAIPTVWTEMQLNSAVNHIQSFGEYSVTRLNRLCYYSAISRTATINLYARRTTSLRQEISTCRKCFRSSVASFRKDLHFRNALFLHQVISLFHLCKKIVGVTGALQLNMPTGDTLPKFLPDYNVNLE